MDWDDAKTYVKWLSRITGKAYRLLSEAEFEYAARAGGTTAYPWGDDAKQTGKAMANCESCGSQWDGKQTASVCGSQEEDTATPPVCSFPANRFGLYDMVRNVWQWTGDCVHYSYAEAPVDGSPWVNGDCSTHIARGGSWTNPSSYLRSASRFGFATVARHYYLGFRVAPDAFRGHRCDHTAGGRA